MCRDRTNLLERATYSYVATFEVQECQRDACAKPAELVSDGVASLRDHNKGRKPFRREKGEKWLPKELSITSRNGMSLREV